MTQEQRIDAIKELCKALDYAGLEEVALWAGDQRLKKLRDHSGVFYYGQSYEPIAVPVSDGSPVEGKTSAEGRIPNQQELNSQNGIVVDLDKWDHHRIQRAKHRPCPECNAIAGLHCLPLTHFQAGVKGEWVHLERE